MFNSVEGALRRETFGRQAGASALVTLQALAAVVVVSLMMAARAHLGRVVWIAPRWHIWPVAGRSVTTIAHRSWHLALQRCGVVIAAIRARKVKPAQIMRYATPIPYIIEKLKLLIGLIASHSCRSV